MGRKDNRGESFSERRKRFLWVTERFFLELGRKRLWEELKRVFTEEITERGELEANPLFA